MLLIDCPYCGPRPEIEFRCGGEAHIARPARPAEIDDAAWVWFLVDAVNRRHAQIFEPCGDALVGGEHELFD